MTFVDHHKAIRQRIEECRVAWNLAFKLTGTPYECQVAYPNAPFSPPDDNLWVRLEIVDGGSFQASSGAWSSNSDGNFYRFTGLVYIMIFAPLGTGDGMILNYVDQASQAFFNWPGASDTSQSAQTARTAGLHFRLPPYVQHIPNEPSGKWYQMNVVHPFERNTIGSDIKSAY